MNTFEAMKVRKSVRSYQTMAVEPEKIKAVVEAGNMAAGTPMAGKVYFNVITNAEVLKGIVDGSKAVMGKSGNPMLEKISANPNFNPIYGAPVAVVVSTTKAADPNTQSMATQNAACAGENMLVAAADLGLASCYLMSPTMAFFIPEMRAAAKLPEDAEPVCIIVFGYSDDTTPHSDYPATPDNIIYID